MSAHTEIIKFERDTDLKSIVTEDVLRRKMGASQQTSTSSLFDARLVAPAPPVDCTVNSKWKSNSNIIVGKHVYELSNHRAVVPVRLAPRLAQPSMTREAAVAVPKQAAPRPVQVATAIHPTTT